MKEAGPRLPDKVTPARRQPAKRGSGGQMLRMAGRDRQGLLQRGKGFKQGSDLLSSCVERGAAPR